MNIETLHDNPIKENAFYPFDSLKSGENTRTIRGIETVGFTIEDTEIDEIFVSAVYESRGLSIPTIGLRATFLRLSGAVEPKIETYVTNNGADLAQWICTKMADLTSDTYVLNDNGELVYIGDLPEDWQSAIYANSYLPVTYAEIRKAVDTMRAEEAIEDLGW